LEGLNQLQKDALDVLTGTEFTGRRRSKRKSGCCVRIEADLRGD
jgi:hypothetical protein